MKTEIRLEAQDNNIADALQVIFDDKSTSLKELGQSVVSASMYPAEGHYRWLGATIEVEGEEFSNRDLDVFRREFPNVEAWVGDGDDETQS